MKDSQTMLVQVCPLTRSFSDVGLTYECDKNLDLQVGYIVVVPFGKQFIDAVVLEINTAETDVSSQSLKTIHSIKYDLAFLHSYQIELLYFLSREYFTLLHTSLSLFFPRNLREKIKKETFLLEKQDLRYSGKTQTLSPKQQSSFKEICQSSYQKNLFYGVTGSGKTSIYIELIEKQLVLGKQSLLLVPEIILSSQVASKISDYFGKDVLVINSSVSEAKKTKARVNIYSGEAKIIVGTRSSLFYPYRDLGIIIIDEEHDRSYRSDNNPRYDAREIAFKISDLEKIPVILGSGTPSINMMYKAIKKNIGLVTLLEEYKNIDK